jgi:hypothetical protein
MIVHYRIDDAHGNPFARWVAHGASGRPDAAALDDMRRCQELAMLHTPVQRAVRNGRVSLAFDMPLPSVSLVLLSARPEGAPRRVAGLRGEVYAGSGSRENAMICWRPDTSTVLRTYEVLYSQTRGGRYRRVNKPDLVCGAFLHVRKAGSRGFYRVRAVDYWGRKGPVSAAVSA